MALTATTRTPPDVSNILYNIWTGEKEWQLINSERVGDVAVLTLDDRARRNALSHDMSVALAKAVDRALADDAKAIVLGAAPPVFCSGGSLDDLIEPKVPLRGMYEGFLRLAEAPVPTIAAVGGPAIGAGVNLPLACDVVICTSAAVFDPRFLDVGIHPGGGHLWRLRSRVGPQAAAALVLLGEALDGEEAVARGLAWKCVADDELMPTALRLAQRAAGRDGELVARTKASLRATGEVSGAAAAVELELEAQEWSVSRPGFVERVTALRDGLRTRQNNRR
jgi:enoyl-CoA hydratase